ncbi:MAG TPA: hypothetical protein VEI52_01040 [Terriglobales bacterium]|nr:hypothetical protein [Terriglobales bacterium]
MISRPAAERLGRGRKTVCGLLLWVGLAPYSAAQTVPYERTFPQSKADVEKALQELQSSKAGRLPTLDGFADPGDRPFDNFQRGYYQCTVQVTSAPSGGSLVRVSAKLTAWYADPAGSKSGYQLLPSNGRIETDFLDRLQEALGGAVAKSSPTSPRAQPAPAVQPLPIVTDASVPAGSAPLPGEPSASSKTTGSSPFKLDTTPSENSGTRPVAADPHNDELNQQAKSLEEILRNQSHPKNLVAVRESRTPVYMSPSDGAKVLFLASTQDEFELLDMNPTWVHVRISGISRGWIHRSSVEMPDALASGPEKKSPAVSPPPSASANKAPFQVENEEIASFPGSWEPLRGKTVKIISVQEAQGKADQTNSQAKLAFAKSLFDREYAELTRGTSMAAGVVVVFDAEDGGMMATTLPVLEQWKSGTLSEQAMWHRCYFDPPDMFRSSSTP